MWKIYNVVETTMNNMLNVSGIRISRSQFAICEPIFVTCELKILFFANRNFLITCIRFQFLRSMFCFSKKRYVKQRNIAEIFKKFGTKFNGCHFVVSVFQSFPEGGGTSFKMSIYFYGRESCCISKFIIFFCDSTFLSNSNPVFP